MNAADAPRPTCMACVSKHLGQASVLFQEALQGYPEHRWLAMGHLAEAEAESQAGFPEFAKVLRNERKKAEEGDYVPDCVGLLGILRNYSVGDLESQHIADKVAHRVMRVALRELDEDAQSLISSIYVALQQLEGEIDDMVEGWPRRDKVVNRNVSKASKSIRDVRMALGKVRDAVSDTAEYIQREIDE